MKKKFLVWAYCEENLGDDLFLKVLFDRYDNVEWDILHCSKKYETMFSNVKSIYCPHKFSSILRYFIRYKKYDGYILIGGSIFPGTGNWKKGLSDRMYMIKRFKYLNKKVFILGSNFGPYNDKEFFDGYKELFRKCDDVSFRDSYSYNLFSDLDNVRLSPDIVFQLNSKKIIKEKNTVGISVIELDRREDLCIYKNDYNEKIAEIIDTCVKQNKKVTLFSFCNKEGDNIAIHNIMNLIDSKSRSRVSICEYDGDIEKFLDIFKSMENIIATRFHSLILSQLFNQNVFPIIYSNKTLNTLKDIGLDSYYVDIKDIGSFKIEYLLNHINNNRIDITDIIAKSENHFKILDEYIK